MTQVENENTWDRAINLTNNAFQVTSGLDLPVGSQWHAVVAVFLTQAHERLDSVRVLLDSNYWDSGVILTRSLFELAVNLAHIAKDMSARLPEYLQHGGIPTTTEEAEKLQEEVEKGDSPEVKDVVPGQSWKRLKDMCCDLGSDWLKEYETFYRYASVPTHAGSFTLGKNYQQLLERPLPSNTEKAAVLVTALAFHLRVVEIAAKVFPDQIKLEAIKELRTKCRELGELLK